MIVTLLIVMGEIALVLLIVLGAVLWKSLRKRTHERAAVSALVKSISDNQPARVEKLAGRLKDGAQLDDADALAKANELIKKQNRFYQDAIDLYFSRNNEVLSSLDHRLEDLMDQYHAFITPSEDTGNAAPAISNEALEKLSKDIAGLTKDVEGLRSENTDLHRQLKAAEQELDYLGREYVSAFNKNKAANEGEGEQEITALNTVEKDVAAVVNATALDALDKISAEPLEPSSASGDEKTEGENAPEVASEADAGTDTSPPLEADEEKQDQGLLVDLDLSELVGEDAAPARKRDAPLS